MYPSSRKPEVPASSSEKDSSPWLEYDLLDIVGRGAFGVVWRCSERRTGRLFACKMLQKNVINSRSIIAEVQQIAQLSHHRNVVRVFGSYESNEWVFVVMELCSEGDLLSFVNERRGLDEATAATLFRDIVLGVDFCHRNHLLHRDIKPENILLSRVRDSRTGNQRLVAKVGDFGLARRLCKGNRMVGYAGSYPYVAPEIMAHESYDWSADVWSLGVLLYSVLAGYVPDFRRVKVAQKPVHFFDHFTAFNSHPWRSVSPAAKSLITKMLSPRPDNRPSTAEILSDPWLNQGFSLVSNSAPAVRKPGSIMSFWLPWSLPREEECLEGAVPSTAPSADDTSVGSIKFSRSGSSDSGQPVSPLTPEHPHGSKGQQHEQIQHQGQQQQQWRQCHRYCGSVVTTTANQKAHHLPRCHQLQQQQQHKTMGDVKRQVHAAPADVSTGRENHTVVGPRAPGNRMAVSSRQSGAFPSLPIGLCTRNSNMAAAVTCSIPLPHSHQPFSEQQSALQLRRQGNHQWQQKQHQHQHQQQKQLHHYYQQQHLEGACASTQPSDVREPQLLLSRAEGMGGQQHRNGRGGLHQSNAHRRSDARAAGQSHDPGRFQDCLPSASTASRGGGAMEGVRVDNSSEHVIVGQDVCNVVVSAPSGRENGRDSGFCARGVIQLLGSLWYDFLEAASEVNAYAAAGDRPMKSDGGETVNQGEGIIKQEGGSGSGAKVAGECAGEWWKQEDRGRQWDIRKTFRAEVTFAAMDLSWERGLIWSEDCGALE